MFIAYVIGQNIQLLDKMSQQTTEVSQLWENPENVFFKNF